MGIFTPDSAVQMGVDTATLARIRVASRKLPSPFFVSCELYLLAKATENWIPLSDLLLLIGGGLYS